MGITIDDKKTINDLQVEFNSHFPWLRLEFFTRAIKDGGPHGKKLVRIEGITLARLRTIQDKRKFIITPEMTVGALIQGFRDIYGINVRVLRKSGRSWINTTLTLGWTLEEQNKQGEMLSRHRITDPV